MLPKDICSQAWIPSEQCWLANAKMTFGKLTILIGCRKSLKYIKSAILIVGNINVRNADYGSHAWLFSNSYCSHKQILYSFCKQCFEIVNLFRLLKSYLLFIFHINTSAFWFAAMACTIDFYVIRHVHNK